MIIGRNKKPFIQLLSLTMGLFLSAGSAPLTGFGYEEDKQQGHELVIEGPKAYSKEELVYPEEEIVRDGMEYRLKETEIQETVIPGVSTYLSAILPCELEGYQMPPEHTKILIQDDPPGIEYERELTYISMEERETIWRDDFEVSITCTGYDTGAYYFGEMEIHSLEDLRNHKNLILEQLELPEECYRVKSVDWIGEHYEKDGIVYRNAAATGEKKVRIADVKYGGQVLTPDVPGFQYVSTYVEMSRETVSEIAEETVTEVETTEPMSEQCSEEVVPEQMESVSAMDRIYRFLKEHITIVSFSIAIFPLLFGVVFLLYKTRKEKPD